MDFSIFSSMKEFERRQGPISDWLQDLEARFNLAGIDNDDRKIDACKIIIGRSGSVCLGALARGTTWAQAKSTLIKKLGEGSEQDEAYTSLRSLRRGNRSIADLGSEAERLAKLAFPGPTDVMERQASEAILKALDARLALKVSETGYADLEDLIKTARRLEKVQESNSNASWDNRELRDELNQIKKMIQLGQEKAEATINRAQCSHEPPAPTTTPDAYQDPPYRRQGYPPRPPTPNTYQEPRYQRQGYPPRPRTGPPSRRMLCWVCGEPGHLMYNCPERSEYLEWRDNRGRQHRGPPNNDEDTKTNTALNE